MTNGTPSNPGNCLFCPINLALSRINSESNVRLHNLKGFQYDFIFFTAHTIVKEPDFAQLFPDFVGNMTKSYPWSRANFINRWAEVYLTFEGMETLLGLWAMDDKR